MKLIQDGKLLLENLKSEIIPEEQIYSTLRQQGVEDVSEVKEARIEPNRQISVIPFEGQQSEDEGGDPNNPTCPNSIGRGFLAERISFGSFSSRRRQQHGVGEPWSLQGRPRGRPVRDRERDPGETGEYYSGKNEPFG